MRTVLCSPHPWLSRYRVQALNPLAGVDPVLSALGRRSKICWAVGPSATMMLKRGGAWRVASERRASPCCSGLSRPWHAPKTGGGGGGSPSVRSSTTAPGRLRRGCPPRIAHPKRVLKYTRWRARPVAGWGCNIFEVELNTFSPLSFPLCVYFLSLLTFCGRTNVP